MPNTVAAVAGPCDARLAAARKVLASSPRRTLRFAAELEKVTATCAAAQTPEAVSFAEDDLGELERGLASPVVEPAPAPGTPEPTLAAAMVKKVRADRHFDERLALFSAILEKDPGGARRFGAELAALKVSCAAAQSLGALDRADDELVQLHQAIFRQ